MRMRFAPVLRTVVGALAVLTLAYGCNNSSGDDGGTGTGDTGTPTDPGSSDLPQGWSEESHTKKGDANYTRVFPSDQVLRIDLKIQASDWQTMQDDMVSMLGAFGQGGGGLGGGGGLPPGGTGGPPGGGGLPPEVTQACEGKATGDACTVTFNGTTVNGTCADLNGTLGCMGAGGGGPGGGGGGINILPRDPIAVPCTVTFGDKQWNHVGVRFKGNSSIASSWGAGVGKLPLHVKFDQFEDQYPSTQDQRFWGFKDLSFSNLTGDSSFIREKLANDIFRTAGVPTPHSAFYRVYVDFGNGPTYFGLYLANEVPGSAFLKEEFGDSKGNLYKPEGTNANLKAFDEASFEKKSNEDAADWSDVQAFIAALNADRTDAAAWRAGLEKTFSVKGFMRWLAVNTLIENWDAYGALAHNYYLYGDLDDKTPGQLKWIQWDSSLAMQSGRGLSFEMTEVGASWPLIRYTMDDPEYQALYYGFLRDTAAGAFSQASVEPQIRALHDLVAPYVMGTDGEITGYTFLSDPTAFASSVDTLVSHVQSRQTAVQQVLASH